MPQKERVTFEISFDVEWDEKVPGARKWVLDCLRADLRDLNGPIPVSITGASTQFGSYGYQRLANIRLAK